MLNFLKKWMEPKPFNSGFWPVKDGHSVYFAEYGNPLGEPILVFHGGPGGGSRPGHATFANLRKYRVIMFDQRGCCRSEPLGKLEFNDTECLLDDAERLLKFLNVNKRIILRGASWGATLALEFAQRNPKRVKKMLLSQVFLADEKDEYWEFEGKKWHYPEFVEELFEKSGGEVVDFFAKEISSNSAREQLDAANYYGWYERVGCSLTPMWNNSQMLDDKTLAELRIFMHYRKNKFFIEKSKRIMSNIDKIKNIETVIVHNRLDFVCPLIGAYELNKALNKSRLVIVPEFGHVGKLLSKTIKREFRAELDGK